MRVSYPELVAWAVDKIGPELSKKDQTLIRDRFFDEVRRLEWLLSKAKAAKITGVSIDLDLNRRYLKRNGKAEGKSQAKEGSGNDT